jgi:hypothetical protein
MPVCRLCLQAKLSKSNAVCTTGLLYNERSTEKSYACTLSDPSIARLIGPVLPINCKTAAAAAAGAKPGSTSIAAGGWAAVVGLHCTLVLEAVAALRQAGGLSFRSGLKGNTGMCASINPWETVR